MDETIRILPLHDPVIATLGHDPRAPYPEKFWLPTLGPSALFLIRHLADRFDGEPAGFELALAEVSRCLGLGDRIGRSSTVARSLGRLVQFDLAYPGDEGDVAPGPGVLRVRRHLPPINRRHIHRLPPSRQAEHDAWVTARLAEPALAAARHNARRAAVVLSAMGERPAFVERALGSAGFAPGPGPRRRPVGRGATGGRSAGGPGRSGVSSPRAGGGGGRAPRPGPPAGGGTLGGRDQRGEPPERRRRMGAGSPVGDGADRRGHLDRVGHPRLPGAAGRLDQGPQGREALEHPPLHERPRGPGGQLAGPARPPGLGGAAQRRPPGAGRPGAQGPPRHAGHPEHRRAAPAGRLRRPIG